VAVIQTDINQVVFENNIQSEGHIQPGYRVEGGIMQFDPLGYGQQVQRYAVNKVLAFAYTDAKAWSDWRGFSCQRNPGIVRQTRHSDRGHTVACVQVDTV
jgi:hypothetical protein